MATTATNSNMKYSLNKFQETVFYGFEFTIPEQTVTLINELASQVGSQTFVRNTVFSKKELEEGVVIEQDVEIRNLKKLSRGLYIGKRSYIGACSSIGRFTSISLDVKIGLIAHPLNHISTSPVFYAKRRGWVEKNLYNESSQGNVDIGHDVLISANVMILAGVKIGNGAVIGAGSFVNKDVPPYAIAVGSGVITTSVKVLPVSASISNATPIGNCND